MSSVGNNLGGDIMLQLGSMQFGISTAAYQDLSRSTEQRWAAVAKFGRDDALQNLGPGEDTINLRGLIYPEFRGGQGQLDTLRTLMATGKPQLLVDGLGNVHGQWVILRVEERQDTFAGSGVPRRQEFGLSLRKYSDGTDV